MADAVKAADPVRKVLAKQMITVKAQSNGVSVDKYRLSIDKATVQEIPVDKRDEKGSITFDPTSFATPGDHTLTVAAVNSYGEVPTDLKFDVLDPLKTDPNPMPDAPIVTVTIQIQIGAISVVV